MRAVKSFVKFSALFSVLVGFGVVVMLDGSPRIHELPPDRIVLAPSEESAAVEEVVTELNIVVTRNAWEATERALKQMGLKDSVSLKDATRIVCRRNGIAVAEWNLTGQYDSRRLPAGFQIQVSVQDMYALADGASENANFGSGDTGVSPAVPSQAVSQSLRS